MIPSILLLLIMSAGIWFAIHNILLQKNWRKNAENGNFSHIKKEPFPGALCLSALIQSCTGDYNFSARILESVFGRHLDEWSAMTKAVSFAKSLNRDLLVENLTSIIKKQNDDFKHRTIPLVFKALSAAEFMWNSSIQQGEKPSDYLKTLLSYSAISDKESDAYRVLGLEPGANPEKIRKAHRKLAAKYHPDTGSDSNLEMFMKIQTAYEMLK